jgi:hypothetical protein
MQSVTNRLFTFPSVTDHASADLLICQGEMIASLRGNDESSFNAALSARREYRAREYCKR